MIAIISLVNICISHRYNFFPGDENDGVHLDHLIGEICARLYICKATFFPFAIISV